MRDLHELDRYRVTDRHALTRTGGWAGDETCGAFIVPSPVDQAAMQVIASSDGGWDHVSVSRKNRVPNWTEMEHIARLFFRDDEVAVQFHVPASRHISIHPNCLHWWRNHEAPVALPPRIFV